MKKLIKISILSIFVFIAISIFSETYAASASISASKTNVKVGEKVTITVSMNAAAWNTNISGAASKSFAGNSDDGNNITKKERISFTPSSAGTYTFKLGGDVSDGSTNKTTKTTKITMIQQQSQHLNQQMTKYMRQET